MGRRLALEECVRDGACPLLVGVGCDLGSGVRLPGVCLLCPVGTREQRLAFGGVCGPGLARRWFCGFGSGVRLPVVRLFCPLVVVKNFAVNKCHHFSYRYFSSACVTSQHVGANRATNRGQLDRVGLQPRRGQSSSSQLLLVHLVAAA